jgi:hypothetical protein
MIMGTSLLEKENTNMKMEKTRIIPVVMDWKERHWCEFMFFLRLMDGWIDT